MSILASNFAQFGNGPQLALLREMSLTDNVCGRAPCTIVVKLGTSSIVDEETYQPLLSIISAVIEVVVKLRRLGHKVVLVSSGAIVVGMKRMNIPSRPNDLSGKQALAAIGQGRLIAFWDNLFSHLEQPIAQVLLTRGDISDRTRYLNAVNTFKELLSMGVVPIVNENDTISVSEIKFGDNDTLSAITASMIQADYLFLLTDVDGLYTSNPRKDTSAELIQSVSSITEIRSQVSTSTLGSNLGTGGMETKLIAADIATAAGVTTIITSSKKPENIFGILEYHNYNSFSSTPHEPSSSGRSSPIPVAASKIQMDADSPLTRPPHTVFTPSPAPLQDLKSWISHTLYPAGSVVIDARAHNMLSGQESTGRLLPAGVLGVHGTFASGQAVRIVIRRSASLEDPEVAKALLTCEQPMAAVSKSLLSTENGTDFEEVGRGLANYNSAQIARVKGVNGPQIPQLLGYADSEFVVENITIRIAPYT